MDLTFAPPMQPNAVEEGKREEWHAALPHVDVVEYMRTNTPYNRITYPVTPTYIAPIATPHV
jgi:hypothetical protein